MPRLVQNWKLTAELASAIAGHHDLRRCAQPEFEGISALVSVADYMCYACGLPGKENTPVVIQPEVWEITGLTNESMTDAMEKFFDSFSDIEELVELAS